MKSEVLALALKAGAAKMLLDMAKTSYVEERNSRAALFYSKVLEEFIEAESELAIALDKTSDFLLLECMGELDLFRAATQRTPAALKMCAKFKAKMDMMFTDVGAGTTVQ